MNRSLLLVLNRFQMGRSLPSLRVTRGLCMTYIGHPRTHCCCLLLQTALFACGILRVRSLTFCRWDCVEAPILTVNLWSHTWKVNPYRYLTQTYAFWCDESVISWSDILSLIRAFPVRLCLHYLCANFFIIRYEKGKINHKCCCCLKETNIYIYIYIYIKWISRGVFLHAFRYYNTVGKHT